MIEAFAYRRALQRPRIEIDYRPLVRGADDAAAALIPDDAR